jgi:YceI-like protein
MRSLVLRPVVLWAMIPVVAILTVGGSAMVYLQAHKPPPPLSLASPQPVASASPSAPSSDNPCTPPPNSETAAVWLVRPGSQAGYRAHELFVDIGLHEVVARTDHVQGYAAVDSSSGSWVVTAVCVAVEPAAMISVDTLPPPLPPATNRDGHYEELFDTPNHRFVIFRAQKFTLPAAALGGKKTSVKVPGTLSMRGQDHEATASMSGVLSGQLGNVAGSMVINATEWGMELPGEPLVRPDITIEFALQFARP